MTVKSSDGTCRRIQSSDGRVVLVLLRHGHHQPHAQLAAAQGDAAGDIVRVADPGDRAALEPPADQLADRVEIGHRLAGVAEIGQPVDDRAMAVLGQIDGRGMAGSRGPRSRRHTRRARGRNRRRSRGGRNPRPGRGTANCRPGGPSPPRNSPASATTASRRTGPSRGRAGAARAAPSRTSPSGLR